MTRKDFRKFAEMIQEMITREDGHTDYLIAEFADELANICKQGNSNFNRLMFYGACGLDSNGNVVR
jgi:hypothetical protein